MKHLVNVLIATLFVATCSPVLAAPETMNVTTDPQASPVLVTAPLTLQAVVSDLTVMHVQASDALVKLQGTYNTLNVLIKGLDPSQVSSAMNIALEELGAQISALQGSMDGVVAMCPATPRMLKVVMSQCDERPFSGKVSSGMLALTNNETVDVIEAHYRPGKKEPFKAKRLRIEPDGVAYPMEWMHNRGCVRMFSATPLTEEELMTLLNPGESLEQVNISDAGLKVVGPHNTRGVFRIYKK